MRENIDHIIQKYWAGESSLDQEQQLKAYLGSSEVRAEHADMVPLFGFFNEQLSVKSKPIDLGFLAEQSSSEMDTEMDAVIEKYWAGEASLEDEQAIQAYMTSGAVASHHEEMIPLFSFFESQETVVMQKALDMSFLNDTEETTKTIQFPVQAKDKKVRRLFPKVAAIAASLALLMMVTFSYMDNGSMSDRGVAEVQDADEALELTMEALAFLGHKYDKGANPMKHIKQLEKTSIFSFN